MDFSAVEKEAVHCVGSTETDLRLHDGPWTEEDYLALPVDGTRTELLDGGLLVNPSPTVRHQRLSLALEALHPPALVVEIVSPGGVAADRAIKPRLYAEAGIGTYVRIELSKGEPTATVLRLEGGQYRPEGPADAVLRLTEPFAADIDLAALLATDRSTVG